MSVRPSHGESFGTHKKRMTMEGRNESDDENLMIYCMVDNSADGEDDEDIQLRQLARTGQVEDDWAVVKKIISFKIVKVAICSSIFKTILLPDI